MTQTSELQRPVGMAVVGIQGWGGYMAEKMLACPEVRLVAVCDVDAAGVQTWAEKCDCRGYVDFAALLADPEVEGVMLITPNDTHLALTRQAAQAGRHVLVEKPMANTTADARAMIEACHQAGVILGVGHQTRRFAGFRRLRAMLDAGELGVVVNIEAHFSHAGGYNLTPERWRWHRERCPLGPFNLLGVHLLDTIQYLIGKPVAVCAMSRADVHETTADDCVACILAYASGPLVYVGDTYVTPHDHILTVHGTRANVRCEHGGNLLVTPAQGQRHTIEVSGSDPSVEECTDFARAIRGLTEYEVPGEEAYDIVAILEATLASIETGQRQPVHNWRS